MTSLESRVEMYGHPSESKWRKHFYPYSRHNSKTGLWLQIYCVRLAAWHNVEWLGESENV